MLVEALVCLALNVYHEARDQSPAGKEAVAHVVLNRVADPSFPGTVCGVILQGGERLHRCQFSWYCDGRPDLPFETAAWRDARAVARRVLGGSGDPTYGATYYHADTVSPSWAKAFTVTAEIGNHIFYRENTK